MDLEQRAARSSVQIRPPVGWGVNGRLVTDWSGTQLEPPKSLE
jgi:hypothetical protein